MAGIEVPGSAVVEVLDARGGQAVVYRARQPSVADRHAAIKVYTRLLADDRGRRQFEREVAGAAVRAPPCGPALRRRRAR